ncbi:MAG TPA: flagellar basal body rod protein FlgC [Anaerolineaceae bacterium]
MSFWNTLRISETALNAQRLRLDTISNNLANIETTHTVEGGPYQRKDVVFTPKGENQFRPTFIAARRNNGILNDPSQGGVTVASIVTDTSPGSRVYDPTHPDADKEGFVTYPNVNIITEMTNMLSATRSYEANLAAVDASKRMALRALEIGR